MRVLVAMSGGVDSSVVAARMVDAGHEVVGVHLSLANYSKTGRGCGNPTDTADAKKVAEVLGVELLDWDLSEQFEEAVIGPWVAGYRQGITPNPCLICNRTIKFSALQERAFQLGFDTVATGHYARLGQHNGKVSLHRAAFLAKDQSYVLSVLNQHQLAGAAFPLGDMESKEAVRAEARSRGLPVATKPDSFDICFIPDGDTSGFLDKRIPLNPGPILSLEGKELGVHHGTHRFTVGQRKGLNIRQPAPDGKPRYVLEVIPATNTVVVGSRQDLAITQIVGNHVSWTEEPVWDRWTGFAQVRAHGKPLPATFSFDGQSITAELDDPTSDVANGQGLVMYDQDRVVGSSTVCATNRGQL